MRGEPTLTAGKSSLLLRFTDDDFLSEEETTATIGVDFKSKVLDVDGKRYKLSIWVSVVVAESKRDAGSLYVESRCESYSSENEGM